MSKGINVAIVLFSFGILIMLFLSIKDVKLIITGARAEGTVYQLYAKDNPNIRMPGVKYNIPIISFFTSSNERFETWGCPDCYKIGDKVSVIYDPNNPSNAEVYSRGLYESFYYLVGMVVFLLLFIMTKIKLRVK